MQLHEKKGKHGAPVTCGDWLFDNRLGLASGLRVTLDLAPPTHQGVCHQAPTPPLCSRRPACSLTGEDQPACGRGVSQVGVLFQVPIGRHAIQGARPAAEATRPHAVRSLKPGATLGLTTLAASPQPPLQVPKHIRAAGAPSMLQFTSGYPPFVAVAVGAKCAQQVTSDLAGLRALTQCTRRVLC
jgi:hypothetical protein